MTTNWDTRSRKLDFLERLGNSCIMKQYATVICWNTKHSSHFIPLRSNIQCPIYEFELARREGYQICTAVCTLLKSTERSIEEI